MRDAGVRRFGSEPVGEHGLAADHALAERNERHIGRRDIDVDPRAETNEADALGRALITNQIAAYGSKPKK